MGSIVAQDGRVIAIVAHEVSIRPDEVRFYRGIPGAEVVRCLNDIGLGHLVALEDWACAFELRYLASHFGRGRIANGSGARQLLSRANPLGSYWQLVLGAAAQVTEALSGFLDA